MTNAKRLHIATCEPCGKRSYTSRKDAREIARDCHRGEHLDTYRCPVRPSVWHIGHMPRQVIEGRAEAAGWRRKT